MHEDPHGRKATQDRKLDKPRKLRHPRDTFHAFMVEGASFDPEFDMPLIRQDSFIPTALVPFSIAMRSDWSNFNCAVHFCERDQDIEPFWSNPRRYLPKLRKFQGALGLDYSTCIDFPRGLKVWNAYRNRACNYTIQAAEVPVIPLLRGDPDILAWEIAGLPRGGMIAVSPRGCVKSRSNRKRFERALRDIVDALEPAEIVSYGGNSYNVLSYPMSLGIPVHMYRSRGRGNLGGGALSVEV